jgi:S1-C subfamily serine protease
LHVSHYVLLLAGVLLGSPSVEPVSYEQVGSRMATARVTNWVSGYQHSGPTVNGSGTLTAVDGDAGLVLTAAHLFQENVGPVTVTFTDGQHSGARILALDEKLDIAALWIYAPRGIEPVPIAPHDPQLGEQVEIWGYGPKRFRSFLAVISEPLPRSDDVPKALVAAQGVQDRQVTIPGDSGGPIVSQGKLVAVHWGYRGDENDPRRCVHALGCDTLRGWLKQQLTPSVLRRCLTEPARAVSMN